MNIDAMPPKIVLIIEETADYFGMNPGALLGPVTRGRVLLARRLALFMCRQYTNFTAHAIGDCFNRDTTSAKDAFAYVARRETSSDIFAGGVRTLRALIERRLAALDRRERRSPIGRDQAVEAIEALFQFVDEIAAGEDARTAVAEAGIRLGLAPACFSPLPKEDPNP